MLAYVSIDKKRVLPPRLPWYGSSHPKLYVETEKNFASTVNNFDRGPYWQVISIGVMIPWCGCR